MLTFRSLSGLSQSTAYTPDAQIVFRSAEGDYLNSRLDNLKTYITADVNGRVDDLVENGTPGVWPNARTLVLSGQLSGTTSFDGSADINLNAQVVEGSLTTAHVEGLTLTLSGLSDDTQYLVNALDGDGEVPGLKQTAWQRGSVDLGESDLDTTTGSGYYLQPVDENASLGLNYPVELGGLLEVFSPSATLIWQRYTPRGGTDIWMRAFYADEWTDWSLQSPESNENAWSQGPTIPPETNLNDLRQSGYYLQDNDLNAKLELNNPVANVGGLLMVYAPSLSRIWQEYRLKGTNRIFKRRMSGFTWSQWTEEGSAIDLMYYPEVSL